jgi:alpha-mannosidase
MDRDNVILETVKQAEDGSASVLRLYEAYNCRSHVNMKFGRSIRRLTECNLMERGDREISFDNDSFQFDIKPLEIMTFKVEFEDI